jgi:hypothetical protein
MTTSTTPSASKFTGVIAVLGGLIAFFTIFAMLTSTDGDMTILFDPAALLGSSAEAHGWLRTAMLADIFGFYLPFFVIGGYLWAHQRQQGGALVDMAMLFISFYVVLGAAGAAVQYAVLPALAQTHLHAEPMYRIASESAWAAVVHGSQKGLWWLEGPLMLFWVLVSGPLLRKQGWGFGRLLMVSGVLYGVVFVGSIVGVPAAVTENLSTLAVSLLPLWMLLFGIDLLRGRHRNS